MGSPLRIHGAHLVGSIDDPHLKGLVAQVLQTGSLGFDLLGSSLWLSVLAGFMAIAVGAFMLLSRRQPLSLPAA
jgi:hypothetical protein